MTDLVEIIGRGGKLSLQVSRAFMLMIVTGGENGELELREIVDPETGDARTVKAVPEAWKRRLVRAVEVGAFTKKSPDQIAHRILTTPEAN